MKLFFKRAPGAAPEQSPPPPSAPPPVATAAVTPAAVPPAAPIARADHKSLYRQLIGGLYDAVLITDPKGHVIDSNGRVENLFQYDKNEVWDMEVSKLMPGITSLVINRVQQGLADKRQVLIDARCVRKDGVSFAGEVAICAIDLINDGDLVFCVRNVDRRKRTLQLYRGMQHAMANDLAAVAICDAELKIVFANRALRELWGAVRDEDIIGQPLVSLWPTHERPEDPVRAALSGERWTGTIKAVARDGRPLRLNAAIQVYKDSSDKEAAAGLVCSFVMEHGE